MEHLLEYARALGEWAKLGLLAAFGGMASYLYIMVTKNHPFRWLTFGVNLFLAFFVGKSLGGFIPADSTNFAGWIMLLGFCAYPLLGRLETKLLAYLDSRVPGGQ